MLKQCETHLKKDPKQPEVRTFLAMAKSRLGEPREAIALLTSVVRVSGRPCQFSLLHVERKPPSRKASPLISISRCAISR